VLNDVIVPHHVVDVVDSARPVVLSFLRAYSRTEEDYFVLLMQTEPLFRDLPTEQQVASVVPRCSHRDIGSEYSQMVEQLGH
jgi:hypothetical protein